jgi:hypothetical protein
LLLLIPLVIATLAALLRGESLRHLAALPMRGSGFIFASLAIQVLLYIPPSARHRLRRWPIAPRMG